MQFALLLALVAATASGTASAEFPADVPGLVDFLKKINVTDECIALPLGVLEERLMYERQHSELEELKVAVALKRDFTINAIVGQCEEARVQFERMVEEFARFGEGFCLPEVARCIRISYRNIVFIYMETIGPIVERNPDCELDVDQLIRLARRIEPSTDYCSIVKMHDWNKLLP